MKKMSDGRNVHNEEVLSFIYHSFHLSPPYLFFSSLLILLFSLLFSFISSLSLLSSPLLFLPFLSFSVLFFSFFYIIFFFSLLFSLHLFPPHLGSNPVRSFFIIFIIPILLLTIKCIKFTHH